MTATASQLNVPLNLLRERSSQDDWTKQTNRWVVYGRVLGRLRPKSGSEVQVADAIEGIQRYELVIRYRPDVTVETSFQDDRDGTVYNAEAVINWEERNTWLVATVVKNNDPN